MEGDVEEVEGGEGDAGVVDCDEDGGEAEVEDDFEGVEEDAFGRFDVDCCFALDTSARRGAGEIGVGGEVLFGVYGGRVCCFECLKRTLSVRCGDEEGCRRAHFW